VLSLLWGLYLVTLRTLVLRYATFAMLAGLANLATQRVVLQFEAINLGFTIAVGAGTAVGLLTKFVLDKRWIFYDTSTGLKVQGQKFALYTTMGIFTTCIFWGTETAFWLVWHTDAMRELGAVLGLTTGYVIKYNLDRHFVFTDAALNRRTPS